MAPSRARGRENASRLSSSLDLIGHRSPSLGPGHGPIRQMARGWLNRRLSHGDDVAHQAASHVSTRLSHIWTPRIVGTVTPAPDVDKRCAFRDRRLTGSAAAPAEMDTCELHAAGATGTDRAITAPREP